MLLENKNAVSYGVGGAIGGGVAKAFARSGARVLLAGRTRQGLDETASQVTAAGEQAATRPGTGGKHPRAGNPRAPNSREVQATPRRGRSSDAVRGGIVMAKQGAHPSGIDAVRTDPRPAIPKQLQASFRLWLVAVAAGLFETAVVVVDATDGKVGSAATVAVGVAIRLLVFTAAVYLAVQLCQGSNWARVALAVLLGGIGTLSLVIGPATWLAEGGSLADAVAAADLGSVLFAASRIVHVGAVMAALVLMFHPAANAYLRATTRAPARRGTRQDRNGGAAR